MKTLLKALLCSVLINLAGFLVNLVSYNTLEKLPLSIRMYGGEWTGHVGFGLLMNEIYPLSPQGSGGVVRSLEMDEWNFENWGIKYWSRTKEFEDYLRKMEQV